MSKRPEAAPPFKASAVWIGLAALGATMAAGAAYRLESKGPGPIAIAPDVTASALMSARAATADARPRPVAPVERANPAARPSATPFAERLAMFEASARAAASAAPSALSLASAAPSASAEPKAQPSDHAARVSLSDVDVVVYTTGWCSVCKRAKAWMSDQGIPYEDRNIETSAEYAAAMRTLNPKGSVPTFDVDGEVMIGFDEQGLLATMKRVAGASAARRHL